MKQLTCEMCGSTELMKQDGVFVCQTCGTKYSVEEAKKMMVEGTVEVAGTVKVDDTAKIGNYYTMAENAYDAGNKQEAENYCNKIIEIDPSYYKAWFLKGKAAGWQSTLRNIRIEESVNCFTKAIAYAPEEKKKNIIEESKSEIKQLSIALISLRGQQFEKYPDEEETNGFLSDINTIFNTIIQFVNESGILIQYKELMESIAVKINASVVKAWEDIVLPEYNGDEGKPNKYDFDKFLDRINWCILLVESAIKLSDEDGEADIVRYENIIHFEEVAITACSWDYDYVDGVKKWRKAFTLTLEAMELREKKITECKKKILGIKKKQIGLSIQKILDSDSTQDIKLKEIMALADTYMEKHQDNEATIIFDHVIQLLPNERVGYFGKAVSMVCGEENVQFDDLFAPVMIAKDKQVSADFAEETNTYLNGGFNTHKINLLMYACSAKRLNVVKALISMGADIHQASNANTTPLWYVCHESLSQNKLIEGREIAKLLLDMGASADVTNNGGVALYNKDTDSEIAKMILEKYPNLKKGEAEKKGGCYVATAVYGSYDCPQVWTLRRFRDYTLAKTWYGRAFIRTYYAISPTLVKWFGKTEWFKKMWQGKLDRMVAKLQSEGVESTPYEDHEW